MCPQICGLAVRSEFPGQISLLYSTLPFLSLLSARTLYVWSSSAGLHNLSLPVVFDPWRTAAEALWQREQRQGGHYATGSLSEAWGNLLVIFSRYLTLWQLTSPFQFWDPFPLLILQTKARTIGLLGDASYCILFCDSSVTNLQINPPQLSSSGCVSCFLLEPCLRHPHNSTSGFFRDT